MKGLYRGTNCPARVAVPTPPCSGPTIIHHPHTSNLPFIIPRTTKVVQIHLKSNQYVSFWQSCSLLRGSKLFSYPYSEHLKLPSSWFRIPNILKDWDPKHVQCAGAGDGCCGPGPDRAGSMSSPFFSFFSSLHNKARLSAWRESASRYSALREIVFDLSFFLSSI